jgi:choline transporter-like protein 2/4/5
MDLYKSSRAIYICIATAIIFCFAYIYLMSYFAEPIAWAIIGITQIALFVGCGGCVLEYIEKKNSTNILYKDSASGFLVGAIVLGLSAIIFLIMLVCGFNQLKVAIDVVDASADFLRKTKRVISVPVVYFFFTVVVVMVWLFAMVCIWSIGTITAKTGVTNPYFQLKTVKFGGKADSSDIYILACVMFFGLLWIVAFFNAQQSFIVMVSACTYYFDSTKDKEGDATVSMGVKWAWVQHAGSLAMGSFIIALVEFVRIVVYTLTEQARKASGDNAAVKCLACLANCIMACIEKIVDYINKAAYSYMAVSGDGFCTSAWNGFLLNMKHSLEFAWAKLLAELFILTGKLSLVAVNCLILYLVMHYVTDDFSGDEAVSSIWSPMIVVAIITFIAASVFLGLFSNTVLALMTCLAIDTDLNGEPKFGPPTFHDGNSPFKGE